VASEGESGVVSNLQRKADQADAMFKHLVALINDELRIEGAKHTKLNPVFPNWL
jgi:hypothetical protein